MSDRLTAKEISDRHGVTIRTAYRWLADGDPRTIDEDAPEREAQWQRRKADEEIRKILDRIGWLNFELMGWAHKNKSHPASETIEAQRINLFGVLDKMQKASGAYDPSIWEDDSGNDEEGEGEQSADEGEQPT